MRVRPTARNFQKAVLDLPAGAGRPRPQIRRQNLDRKPSGNASGLGERHGAGTAAANVKLRRVPAAECGVQLVNGRTCADPLWGHRVRNYLIGALALATHCHLPSGIFTHVSANRSLPSKAFPVPSVPFPVHTPVTTAESP